jgi:hypothetical protein
MNERLIAVIQFLIPHQELAKSVEPGVGGFHHPASILGGTPSLPLLPADPRAIPMSGEDDLGRFALIAPIAIQERVLLGQEENQTTQHCLQLAHVMSVGSGDDQRQRDATPVDQQMALAPIFFPGPSGWDPRPLLPGGL